MIPINQSRLKTVTENMKKAGLPQILVTNTASVYYLTGLWVEPMERMMALHICADGECALFGNALFGWTPGGDAMLYTHTDADDPLRDLVRVLRAGDLGVDKTWPCRFVLGLMEQRPDVTVKLGSGPVDEARMYKDADEIAALRHASSVNDAVMAASLEALHAGVTEAEMAAEIERQYRLHGAQRPPEGVIASFGANAADPHHGPSGAVLQAGDSVVFDIYTPVRQYWCDMTRTVFFGRADDEQRRVYELVRQANCAAEKAVRPGMEMCEIDAVARNLITAGGYGPQFTHRLGHGLGIDCHEPPDNSASDHTVVKPGMVFSIEPGIYLPGRFGVRVEDLVLVTQDGCEVLNHYTKDLQILP